MVLPGRSLALFILFSTNVFAAEQIKILTFNVGLLKTPLYGDIVPHVETRARRLDSALAEFILTENIDVTILEEVWLTRYSKSLAAPLQDRGFKVFRPNNPSFANFIKGKFLGSGLLLLLSPRISPKEIVFTPYEKSYYPMNLATNGYISATLDLETSQGPLSFIFFGTHIEPLVTVDGIPTFKNQTHSILGQLKQLSDAIYRLSSRSGDPSILAGDLNIGDQCASDIYRNFVNESGLKSEAGENALISWDAANPLVNRGKYKDQTPCLIDHVLLKDSNRVKLKDLNTRVVFNGKEPFSDHYAIEAHVEFEK